MLKVPRGMKRDTFRQNLRIFLVKFLTTSLLGVCWLLPESCGVLMKNDYNLQWIRHGRSVWDALCDTTP